MTGKQAAQPPWMRRHAWVVGLICFFATALIAAVTSTDTSTAWLIVPAVSVALPAIVSALPRRGATALAAASAAALVIQTIFAMVAFGDTVHANLLLITALSVIALYERGAVLAWAFAALNAATVAVAIHDPTLVGLDSSDPTAFWTTIATGILATVVTGITLTVLFRSQRRARHIATQQRQATDAYLEVAGTLMLVLDRHGIVTVANRQACVTLQLSEDEIVGREWFELALADEYRDDARRLFLASFEGFREFGELIKAPQDYENEILTRSRVRRQIRWWATFVTDASGRPTGMVCSGTDLTDARVAAASLERNRTELDALRRLAQKVASLDDSRQAVVDAARILTEASAVAIMEPDRTRTRLITTVATNRAMLDYVVDIGKEASVAANALLSGEPQFIAEVAGAWGVNQNLADETCAKSGICQPIVNADGIAGVLLVAWDHHVPSLQERKAELVGLVSHEAAIALRRRESLAQLERAALIDPLTGIANRRAFDAELPSALRRAADGAYPLALVMIDLNEFKAVNDVLGHEAGDHVLIGASGAWAEALRAGDLLARRGGDEFAVLLPTCDELEMSHIIQRLQRVTPHGPGASIGGALWDGTETAESLIRRADGAQYADKAQVRERIRTPGMAPRTHAPRPRAEDPRADH